MRKTRIALSLAAAVFPFALSAAEIHGTVSEGGKPVAKGVALKLDCAGTTAQATTDEFGGYSLKVPATGDCTLSIDYKGTSGSLKVAVYEKPSRYDLAVAQEGGKLSIARK